MKLTTVTFLIFSWLFPFQQQDYDGLKAEAERFYSEKSYAKAYALYQQAEALKLTANDARWVTFRLGDTQWRAEAETQNADNSPFEQARLRLESLTSEKNRDHDLIWVEAHESLGDLYWRRQGQNWQNAWSHYEKAFEWWAGQSDLENARNRYLALFWKAVSPSWIEPHYYGSFYGNALPIHIFENAVQIAQDPKDRARAHFFQAARFRFNGDPEQQQRVAEELEEALKSGKSSDWYDDALYMYAEWLTNSGRITQTESGEWQQEPDYVQSLQLYRRLLTEFRKGETRYYDQAEQAVKTITSPSVGVHASNIFLPRSEVQVNLSSRNVKQIEFRLYKVSLPRDVHFSSGDASAWNWVNQISLSGRQVFRAWSKTTNDDGSYKPTQEQMRIEGTLPTGAYILVANAGSASARELVLVSDTVVVLKTSGREQVIYFCDAISGAPMPNALVSVWSKTYDQKQGQSIWRERSSRTNNDGISTLELVSDNNSGEIFVSAESEDRQAFTLGHSYYQTSGEPEWRIYAFTDRPAYRPGEKVQWKFLARRLQDSAYSTPANQEIEYEIHDPRGNKIREAKVSLNSFGSAWGTLDLTESMTLGAYQITFYDQGRNHIGSANLFRLEEYKLPEFKVQVRTPEVEGRKKAFRLGDRVEVTIGAEYYFGGAVSGATVELVVYQNPFYHYWRPEREYSWYYSDFDVYRYGRGSGQLIKRETLKTDNNGKVSLFFDTPRNNGQDLEYLIEARVTDSSRREIVANNSVRVTRQRYYVYPRAEHNLYRPNDKVEIKLKALDANHQPATVSGEVKVTRDFYDEVWIDETGRELKGNELRLRREQISRRREQFPSPGNQPTGWRLKFRGYTQEQILVQKLQTNTEGETTLAFTPAREGFYRLRWTSPDRGGPMVQAETTVWVTTDRTTQLGYRSAGLEIIVDKDTFKPGQTAPVMITTSLPDRYVLFTVEGNGIISKQLLRLNGTSKLVYLPVGNKEVPNIFLNALMVSERQLFMDNKEVVVPPVKHFLNVEVKADHDQYQPGEEGTLKVTTRDDSGRPVAAEVALGLSDSSVFYIQKDLAGDPRQFYFGTKRQMYSQVQSTFQQRPYARLVAGDGNVLIEEVEAELAKQGLKDSTDQFQELKVFGALQTARRGRQEVLKSGISEFRADGLAANDRAIVTSNEMVNAPPAAKPDGSGQQDSPVQVRSDFRSTAYWRPDVVTDADGTASIKVKYPDSLTSWTATARVATAADEFGIASTETRTQKLLMVRLQAPRFFVAGDSVTVSAIVNNNNDEPLDVRPSLEVEGVALSEQRHHGAMAAIKVPARGEERIDWVVKVPKAGPVKLKVTARGETQADAMEREFIAYEHGIEKFVAKSGKLRGDEAILRLEIPRERKLETTELTLQLAPSMAVTMLDALPYLIDYPYGCTEQTLSRFVPAVVTAKTLKDLGLSPEDAMAKVFGGIEPAGAAATHPRGKRDLNKLNEMVKQGLERLYSMQHDDGGWGWWKQDQTDHFMTAYALWSLSLARQAGVDVKSEVPEKAAAYLRKELVEEESNYDVQAWILHALANHHAALNQERNQRAKPGDLEQKAFANLWDARDKLNSYAKALLALSAHHFDLTDKAQTLVRNLENGVKIDRTPDRSIIERGEQTSAESTMGIAHWGEDGIYYRWSDGGVESTSFALRALLAIDPQNKLVEPVTNWLIKNRRGSQWSNTRDTAIAILALNDYLRNSGEGTPDIGYEVSVNGAPILTRRLTAADALTAPSRFAIANQHIRDGQNEIRIRRTSGRGALYFGAEATFFSLEEPIKSAGNEIFVRRDYFKLVGHPTLLKGFVYDRVALRDGETVSSGDRVEVVVTVEAKNNYEYLLFEDLKPAGLEAVQIRSGDALSAQELKSGAVEARYTQQVNQPETDSPAKTPIQSLNDERQNIYTGRSSFVYQELRDRKVALFVSKLPQGVWEIRYSLRAEVPGTFHALPVLGHAMYVPEIRANDREMIVKVADK
jgi:uncharacterized protein YfaS (alpha-2-macroglobulin family)